MVFSSDASLIAIFNYLSSTGKTHVEIWDVKLKQNISNWETELRIYENADI